MSVTVGVLIGLAPIYPGVWFHALGAVCGGLQGGIGAALNEGDFGDVMLGAGLGAAFGAAVPWGGIGSLVGAAAGYGIAKWAFGNDDKALAQGWEWGGLVGGIAGSARQATLAAAKSGASRPLLSGLMSVGPDLLGGGAGAIYGWCQDGTSTSALRWAQIGMMGASLTGATARGLRSVTRAKSAAPSGMLQSERPQFGVRSRLGPGLAGEHSGPWLSPFGDIVVNDLPGPGGVVLETAGRFIRRVLETIELASLSRHFEDIEFALIRREVGGEMVFRLLSGRPGQVGQITANFDDGWTLIYHTHPGGSVLATQADMNLLRKLKQSASQVVLPDGSVFMFTPTNPNTLLFR